MLGKFREKFSSFKLFNHRLIVSLAIALILGILLGILFCINLTTAVIVLCITICFFISTYIFILIRKKRLANYLKIIITLSLIALFFAIGIIGLILNQKIFQGGTKVDGEYYITGRISSIKEEEGRLKIFLSNVAIDVGGENTALKGKTEIIIYNKHIETINLEIGDNIIAKVSISNKNIFYGNKFNTYYYKHNIKYAGTAVTPVVVESKHLSGLERLREDVRKTLFDNMPKTYSLSYAMVFGDTTQVDRDRMDVFRTAGLEHIFSVSGLHIMFLAGVLVFIFKKIKLNGYAQLALLTVILFVYCMLCGFEPCVIRASIMGVFGLSAVCLGKQYDGLISLSLSALLILLVKPIYLFDVGFQLSFLCVLGMILFTPIFNRLFNKIKIIKNNKILRGAASSLSISLSVNIFTLPVMAAVFGSFSAIGILVNIVAVPIISILYIAILIMLIVALIFPQMGILLISVDYIFYAFEYPLAYLFSDNSSLLKIKGFGYFAIPYFLGLVTFSDLIFLKRRTKLITVPILILISILGIILISLAII